MNRLAALFVSVLLLLLSPASRGFAQSFGYSGDTGPEFWSDLNANNVTCNSGNLQSPVDFGRQRVSPRLDVEYDAATIGNIFHNGQNIEIEIEGYNTLWLDRKRYELRQFHFHTASEHRVRSRGYDMEMHLVHSSADGKNAVIAVFLQRGESSSALAPIFRSLPERGREFNVKEKLAEAFNPLAFLPKSRKHYRYLGSLTTPPCTEGVQWVVMLDPVTVSDEDMAQFVARIGFNARYTQREVPLRR